MIMKIVLDLDRNRFYPLYNDRTDYDERNCDVNHFILAELIKQIKAHNDAMIARIKREDADLVQLK